jgi:sulfur-carrier protein
MKLSCQSVASFIAKTVEKGNGWIVARMEARQRRNVGMRFPDYGAARLHPGYGFSIPACIPGWQHDSDPPTGSRSMATVIFTPNVQRHVGCPRTQACGRTVREVLDSVFAENPQARGYVLDDQAALRRHMTVFVDGKAIRDRVRLADAVGESSTVYVFQALSGG